MTTALPQRERDAATDTQGESSATLLASHLAVAIAEPLEMETQTATSKISERRIGAKACRLARADGLAIRKLRGTRSYDNQGGYMVYDPATNIPVAGFGYDFTAEDVIEYFRN